MEAKVSPSNDGFPCARRVGVLVIHGIGDENPYGTLDSFARGLYTHFQGSPGLGGYTMQAEWKERGSDPSHRQQSWTQAQIRFNPDAAAQKAGGTHIIMAEYYWSPATKGRLKDLDVLTWLIRAALEPFRYLGENIQAMLQSAQAQTRNKAQRAWDATVVVAREFWRLGFLYLPLLLTMIAIGAFLETLPALPRALSSVDWRFPHDTIAMFAVVRLLVLYSLLGYLFGYYKWMRFRVPAAGPQRRFGARTLFGALLLFAALALVPVWLVNGIPATATVDSLGHWNPDLDKLGFIAHWILVPTIVKVLAVLYNSIVFALPYLNRLFLLDGKSLPLFQPLLSLGIAALIRIFFVEFLGDIAIYTNPNQRSANFAIRAQILEECGHALTSLYLDLREESPEDLQIVIAAHSLGTVIAYDTLNDLFNRARIGAAPVGSDDKSISIEICKHFGGLLTFGCPLNKIYYFFRDQSAGEELVRAQIIDGLHSLRLASPADSLPGAPVQPVDDRSVRSLIEQFQWINIWATSDVVSGKLFFYRPSRQIHRPYKVPFPLSHLRYWRDEEMYRVLASDFLCIPLQQPPSVPASDAQTKRVVPIGA
jgi:hypothetical protein